MISYPRLDVFYFLLAATKLGQGDIFTGFCHSVNRGEGGALSWGGLIRGGMTPRRGMVWGGIPPPGGMVRPGVWSQGCLVPGDECSQGMSDLRGVWSGVACLLLRAMVCPGVWSEACLLPGSVCSCWMSDPRGCLVHTPTQDSHCCRGYASYYNALLFLG